MKSFKLGRGLIALAIILGSAGAVGATSVSTAGAADCGITNWHGLVSAANGMWVSAELNYPQPGTGMLRARATTQGAWEKLQFVATSDHHIAIKSLANGKYVSADFGYPASNPLYGALVAHANAIGPWEKFDQVPGFGCALRSVQNGKYVSTEIAYPGANYAVLRARATTVGQWELYAPTRPTNTCANPFRAGESWTGERTDRGVDYYAHGPQPVRAICDGTILSLYTPGWPGGAFIYYRLNGGQFNGKCIYQAEHISVAGNIHVGSVVHAGDVLGYGNGDNEWGWARAQGAPSTPKVVDSHGNELATDGGRAFARFLRSLGAPTKEDPGPGPQYAGASC